MMVADHHPIGRSLETLGAWLLGLLWMLPLLYAVWTAFHPAIYATHFDPLAPLTFANLEAAWQAAPFTRYLINTVMLVTLILAAQFVLCTLAAFAFARLIFPGRDLLFAVVLLQLMVMPDVLLVENYRTLVQLHLADTILAIALPYLGSAFGIFLLRQTFLTIPQPLDDAARLEGCGLLARLWRVYVPLAKPTYIAYGLVSVSYHWNNFLWPLVITNSVTTRPLTVGLADLRHHRPGHRLVDRHRRHADDQRAAAGCLPAVPAAIRAELHARGDPMTALADRFDTAVSAGHRGRRARAAHATAARRIVGHAEGCAGLAHRGGRRGRAPAVRTSGAGLSGRRLPGRGRRPHPLGQPALGGRSDRRHREFHARRQAVLRLARLPRRRHAR